jgi:hypothetical protein
MPRGGSRPNAGRRKQSRPTDGNLARQIKAKIKAEERWLEILAIETEQMREEKRTEPLKRTLMYLDDRDFGPRTQKVELDGKLQLDLAARRDRVRELLSRLAGGVKR